jgi:hypothetical protein
MTMRKFTLLILGLSLLLTASWAKGLSLSATVSYLAKSDSGFKEVYGSGGVMPGLRLEAAVWKGLSLYGSYGYFAKTGTTPVLAAEAKTTQHFIGAGAAWRGALAQKLDWVLYGGLLYVSYREEALGDKVTGSAIGVEIGGRLDYSISGSIFLFPFVSYLQADDTIEDMKIKLGGFAAGIGAGIRL